MSIKLYKVLFCVKSIIFIFFEKYKKSSLLKNSTLGWSSRILQMAFQFFSVRITMNSLGMDGYAAIILLTGLMSWLNNSDFGFSYGIMNSVSVSIAKGEDLNSIKSLSVLCYIVLSVVFFSVSVLICPMIADGYLSALKGGDHILMLTYTAIILSFIGVGNIGCRLLFAEQHVNLYYFLYMCSTSVSFILLFFLSFGFIRGSVMSILYLTYIPQIIIGMFSLIYSCKGLKFILPKISLLKDISLVSLKFLGLNLLTLMTVSTDTFIISQCLSSHDISVYGIYMKLFNAINVLITTPLGILWPRFSAFAAKQEWTEMKRILRSFIITSITIMIIFGAFIYINGEWLINLLAPGKGINATIWFVFLLTILQICILWTGSFHTAVISMNVLVPALILTPLQAVIAGFGEWYLAKKYGVIGVPLGILISYIAIPVWFSPLLFNLVCKVKKNSTENTKNPLLRFFLAS